MTTAQVMDELKKKGSENIKKIFLNHGAQKDCYGVKIGDLKVIQKKIKKDNKLAIDLYKTGNYDAMYLAGLITDDKALSKKEIQALAEKATSHGIALYTVAWIAAESNYGWELGMEWIESKKELIACAGWNTLSGVISMKPDTELDIATIKKLLKRIEKEIHSAQNMVRYTMNNFVICTGSYVKELNEASKEVGKKIGDVMVDMGNTACKVPFAPDYIGKATARGSLDKKKKTVKC
jgi:3-methyladenine DNA glycosylase AlkD